MHSDTHAHTYAQTDSHMHIERVNGDGNNRIMLFDPFDNIPEHEKNNERRIEI